MSSYRSSLQIVLHEPHCIKDGVPKQRRKPDTERSCSKTQCHQPKPSKTIATLPGEGFPKKAANGGTKKEPVPKPRTAPRPRRRPRAAFNWQSSPKVHRRDTGCNHLGFLVIGLQFPLKLLLQSGARGPQCRMQLTGRQLHAEEVRVAGLQWGGWDERPPLRLSSDSSHSNMRSHPVTPMHSWP